jgi:hypothetical protein
MKIITTPMNKYGATTGVLVNIMTRRSRSNNINFFRPLNSSTISLAE